MPYSTSNPPEMIKDLPSHAQAMFIAAYNAANKDGKPEKECMQIAWTAVKTKYKQDADGKWVAKSAAAARIQRGEIIALAGSAPSGDGHTRTIQVLRTGEFTDMHGTEVPILSADLDAYVAHSNARLASDELPIELGHPDDPGAPAAAWYRRFFKQVIGGVEWVCAEIELSALGAQSLADQLYKYFSANLDLTEKVICGGGFVNRPAVRGQQAIGSLAQYLQPKSEGSEPVTLKTNPDDKKGALAFAANLLKRALGIAQLEMSQEQLRDKLCDALKEKYCDPVTGNAPMNMPYIIATYADSIIVVGDDQAYFQIPFTLDDAGEMQLGDPTEVEITWTAKAGGAPAAEMAAAPTPLPAIQPAAPVAAATLTVSNPAPAPVAAPAALSTGTFIPTPKGGETNMGDQTTTTPVVTPPPANAPEALTPEARIATAREEARLAALGERDELEKKINLAREQERTTILAEMARKQEVITLATKLTSGKFQLPYKTDELNAILIQLTDADRAIVAPVLEKIHTAGVVELGERGSNGHGGGFKELAAYAKPLLKDWLAKGDTAEAFFAANPELGKMS